MALQAFPNLTGLLLLGGPNAGYGLEVPISYGNRTMDAAGESAFSIGRLVWADGGTHTVSSAGGRVTVNAGNVTFANAGTTLRVGIQDLSSGLEDGTFDAYVDLTGGGGGITANALNRLTIASGSKSIADGAFVAIGAEMTARGGADTVTFRSLGTFSNSPYVSADTGSGPTRVAALMPTAIEADDGTVGWILGCPIPFLDDTVSVSDTTTPDEIALIFQLPFPARVEMATVYGAINAGDTLDFRVYTDPLGTPTQQRSVSFDPTLSAQSATVLPITGIFSSTYDLSANTLYAVSVRGTGSAFTVSRMTVADASHRAATPGGTNWRYGSRSDDTGAFSETTTILPRIGLYLQAFDDGAGGGGGSAGGARILGGTVIG